VTETWGTDTELQAARSRLAAGIQGYVEPAAFSVARIDGATLAYGHINKPGGIHRLPAVVLASICGYSSTTGVFRLSRDDLVSAIELLTPAEAATHMDHPNLWSWRELMKGTTAESEFIAFFVADLADTHVNDNDSEFRRLIGP